MELMLNFVDYAENRPLDGYSSGGELSFAVDGKFFPAEHWYDCVYADLKIWLPQLISFGSGHTDSCEFSFMDGPFAVRLSRLSDGSVYAVFLRHQKVADAAHNVDMSMLLKSALSCCRKYDRILHENGQINQFSDEIRMLMKLLDT